MDFEAQNFSTFSDDSDSDVIEHKELEKLYGLPKLACDLSSTEEKNQIKRKRNGQQQERERLPTRRPDPNVYNRNALLARENRRKKKQHLESMETNLKECKRVNTVLLEALKRQRKVARRLEREKQYYKNIVSNRTDIQTLVAALNGRLFEKTPSTSSSQAQPLNNYNLNNGGASSPTSDSLYSHGSHSSHSSFYEPEYHNFDNTSDNEFEQPTIMNFEDNWEQLLDARNIGINSNNNNNIVIEHSSSETDVDILSNISKDHCYVNAINNNNNKVDETLKDVTGICLHVQAGKISLEFCPTCNWNSNQAPPEQLLQQDSII